MAFISGSIDCPFCGSNHKAKCFYVYEDGYHCFSCGKSKRAIRNFTTSRLISSPDIELPEMTMNPSLFSLPILRWLREYHITDDIIYKYNIGEAKDNSLIMPVLYDDKVVMYQRRWFNPRKILTSGSKVPFIAKSSGESDTIVIVEDFISAIRVGTVVNCYCMFGTSIPQESINTIVSNYRRIIIWADGDTPGQLAAKKLSDKLQLSINKQSIKRSFSTNISKDIVNILTEHDPKYYTNTQIRDIITNNHGESNDKKI